MALEAGAQLLLCMNPLVPFNAKRAGVNQQSHRKKLVDGGLPAVLSQAWRVIIHPGIHVSLANDATLDKDAHMVFFEPRRDVHARSRPVQAYRRATARTTTTCRNA